MFIRAKKRGNLQYFYIVENKREDGRTRQRVVEYLGNEAPGPARLAELRRKYKALI